MLVFLVDMDSMMWVDELSECPAQNVSGSVSLRLPALEVNGDIQIHDHLLQQLVFGLRHPFRKEWN